MARLKTALVVLLLIPVLVWGAFRIWLVQQEPSLRDSIEAFSTLEFLVVLRDFAFPRKLEDRAGFGRREVPGRGHAPWVLRSSLDGRPRILSLALAPDLWLAYSTESGSIHQFWKGDVDFTGPVYDAQHGFEPTSRGQAFLRPPVATGWRVREDSHWRPARVQWLAHGVDPESGVVWLQYDVSASSGAGRTVTEWPDVVRNGERVGLERRFVTVAARGPAVALVLQAGAGEIETERPLQETAAGSLLELASESTRLVQWFDSPAIAIDREEAESVDEDVFAAHDCHTCHNERERVVGPAWSEIALRYAGTNPVTTLEQLATRIIEGSVGQWGPVAMTPHPDLSREEAVLLARHVLATDPAESRAVPVDDSGATGTWNFGFRTEPRPDSLHPSLSATRIHTDAFTPRVGGLAWLPDGRLAVATWDRDGAVFAVDGWNAAPGAARIERIAEGLHEPLGLAAVGGDLYVMQKQELTKLVDRNGDGWIDEYRAVANGWQVTSNFHEFGFGLAHRDGHLYGTLSVCVLNGGKSCRQQTPDRGKAFRVSLDTGEMEFVASGLRTPNGVAIGPDGKLLITDNQGDWLPASKLIVAEAGDFYGWRAPGDDRDHGPVVAPTLWLPQNEVGNSPTQPLVLTQGPYAGQVLFGDVFNGGIKRAFLEEVAGRWQGAAFHFSGGLGGPVNRLLAAPDGSIVVGEIGSAGNWGEFGKEWFGLELLRFSDEPAFEPMRLVATPGGFDVHFSRPVGPDVGLAPGQFQLSQWFYIPSEIYGGPKYDLTELSVRDVAVSRDRRMVSLEVDGLKEGRVVYLHMDRNIRSDRGEPLWVNEAWYTLHAIPRAAPQPESAAQLANTLSAGEREAGWRLLFDGESFDGWKIYGAEDDAIEGWRIEDGALEFTRDVSFAGLVWNHINPFSHAALDLMTKERFQDFELAIDWKISPGGNSGIFYLVPDEASPLSWDYALEMQVLDDAGHSDGQIERHRAGDLYDLQSSVRRMARPVGQWNSARIRKSGDRIEHWLNGEKVVDLTRGSPAWQRAMADSKFAGVVGFGAASSGHITLQDHGDPVWYRNIKVRAIGRADGRRHEAQ